MKRITATISDTHYEELLKHFSKPEAERMGTPLVAVIGPALGSGLYHDIIARQLENEKDAKRVRTVTDARVRFLALQTGDAYMADSYGPEEWLKATFFLADKGLNAEEITEVLRSKWMRWAADTGSPKASHLKRYVKTLQGGLYAAVAELMKEARS